MAPGKRKPKQNGAWKGKQKSPKWRSGSEYEAVKGRLVAVLKATPGAVEALGREESVTMDANDAKTKSLLDAMFASEAFLDRDTGKPRILTPRQRSNYKGQVADDAKLAIQVELKVKREGQTRGQDQSAKRKAAAKPLIKAREKVLATAIPEVARGGPVLPKSRALSILIRGTLRGDVRLLDHTDWQECELTVLLLVMRLGIQLMGAKQCAWLLSHGIDLFDELEKATLMRVAKIRGLDKSGVYIGFSAVTRFFDVYGDAGLDSAVFGGASEMLSSVESSGILEHASSGVPLTAAELRDIGKAFSLPLAIFDNRGSALAYEAGMQEPFAHTVVGKKEDNGTGIILSSLQTAVGNGGRDEDLVAADGRLHVVFATFLLNVHGNDDIVNGEEGRKVKSHPTRYAPETPFDAASIESGQAYTVPKFPFVRYGLPAKKSVKKQPTIADMWGKSEN